MSIDPLVTRGPQSRGVTAAAGFRAAGVAAGLKASGGPDVALLVNDGPRHDAAAVFTSNRIKAAPVLWTAQCAREGRFRAVVLNSGGANACTGPQGFADTHRTAEHVAEHLGVAPIEVAVCSTGLIGELLPMQELLAPGLATMLVVLTTDAEVDAATLDAALRQATRVTFDRIDSDGCMSTNDTVLLLASGASGVVPDPDAFAQAVTGVCSDLARQLIADAEGATKDIRIDVAGAATEDEAVTAARAVSRSNLLKCAIHGEDPNWGRIISAVGTTDVTFEPDAIDVAINGVTICRDGAGYGDRSQVDMSGREVTISIDLRSGAAAATLWTNDLTAMYVHENSAYST